MSEDFLNNFLTETAIIFSDNLIDWRTIPIEACNLFLDTSLSSVNSGIFDSKQFRRQNLQMRRLPYNSPLITLTSEICNEGILDFDHPRVSYVEHFHRSTY